MTLTEKQIISFDQDGYLILRNLFSKEEITVLQTEAARIAKLDTEGIIKENKTSTPKIMLRMHDPESPTSSPAYVVAARLPRVLGAAQQVLRTRDLYLHHSKINIKGAIEGSVWPWHQDFGQWRLDGILKPNLVTFMIMLDEATELGGGLHFQPGSHRLGRIDPQWDQSTAYNFYSTPTEDVKRALKQGRKPVAITGCPGDAVLFHCNLLHSSGQNLSAEDRRQVYFCYNPTNNRPREVDNPRPEYARSTNWEPVQLEENASLLGSKI